MANTYSQIYLQFVIVVQDRAHLIPNEHKDELCKYTTGIIQNKGHKLIALNGISTHLHIFVGFNPKDSIADFIKEVKRNATNFVNDKKWLRNKFSWQEGYGVFSYSHSQIDRVYRYIENQETHHKKISFREEYLSFLKKFGVDYDEQYIFKEID